MKTKMISYKGLILLLGLIILSGCDTGSSQEENNLQASGIIETTEIAVSPEISGRVIEVLFDEGQEVSKGNPLFIIEDESIDIQISQAEGAVKAAQAGLLTAKASLDSARALLNSTAAEIEAANTLIRIANTGVGSANIGLEGALVGVDIAHVQYQAELMVAQQIEMPFKDLEWSDELSTEFELPVWYYVKDENIHAAEMEVEVAEESLESEQRNFESLIGSSVYDELRTSEIRIAEAQASFLVIQELRDRDIERKDGEELDEYIEELYDSALAELDAAQFAYDQLLTDSMAAEILESRARLATAIARVDIARNNLFSLMTGEESAAVKLAETVIWQAEIAVDQARAQVVQAEDNVLQAEANAIVLESKVNVIEANIHSYEAAVMQAQAMVEQAQAPLDLLNLQKERLTITSAVSGVVLTRNIEPGELIYPGITAMIIGKLDRLTVTVYIPENKYGLVKIGQTAALWVDSFPTEQFKAKVTHISDQAEYTPRNVQTKDDRQTTVFAIELSVQSPDGKLKPGMPADVEFAISGDD